MAEIKNIVVLGAGESGVGAAILAKVKGYNIFVSDNGTITDKYKKELNENAIEWEEQGHTMERIFKAAEVIKSPGIPDSIKLIKDIKEKGIPVISEIEFAGRYTNAYSVCITGSNGKTTTTLLIYEILKQAGLNVGLAGNIGDSFARQVARNNYNYYVLELSSFQLDGMYDYRADIAVILNITPDHLDRYDNDFAKYVESKFRILQNTTKDQKMIFCQDDDVIIQKLQEVNPEVELMPFSLKSKVENGAYRDNEQLIFTLNNGDFIMNLQDLALQGKHNAYNSMAAGLAASVLKIRKENIRDCLTSFKGVEHRLERVIRVHQIEFINDSKATNVNSTWYALESMKKKTVWIVGGVDKGNDYSLLLPLVKEKVKAIVCLGIDNSKLHKAFDGVVNTVVDAGSMEEAVRSAYFLATNDEAVLLSPACASFDLFENYEDRGRKFKTSVRNL